DAFQKDVDQASAWGLLFTLPPPPGPLRPEIPQAVVVHGLAESAAGMPAFPQAAATALMVARLNFWAGRFYGNSWRELASAGADLAAQLADLGKKAESAEVYRMAVAVYSQAIGLNPGLADECHNRAWHLTFDPEPMRRDGRQAAAFAQLAVKAAPTN